MEQLGGAPWRMSPQADESTDGENRRMDVKVNGEKIIRWSCEPRARWRMNCHHVAGPPDKRMWMGTGYVSRVPRMRCEGPGPREAKALRGLPEQAAAALGQREVGQGRGREEQQVLPERRSRRRRI